MIKHTKHKIIDIIAKLDNGSHSSNQLQGIDEALTALFYEELKEIKKELEDKLLIKCECENGGCPNCQRLCEVIDNIL